MDEMLSVSVRVQVLAAQLAALQMPRRESAVHASAGSGAGGGLASDSKPEASFSNLLAQAISQASTTMPISSRPLRAAHEPGLAPGPVDAARDVTSAGRAITRQAVSSFPNGRLPAVLLRPIDANNQLSAPAATSYLNMVAAAASDGVSWHVNDSYRSFDQQVEMAHRKGLYSQGGLAATPGTSDHGWGRSVDLNLNGQAQAWLRSHAASFGFSANVPRESWHWTFAAKA